MNSLTDHDSTTEHSIAHHLRVLLRTRKGSVLSSPQYGMPERQAWVGKAQDEMMRFLKHCILRLVNLFEPRMIDAQIDAGQIVAAHDVAFTLWDAARRPFHIQIRAYALHEVDYVGHV